MTKTERVALQVHKAEAKEAQAKRETQVAKAAQRELTRQATNKRRYHVGTVADEEGLFVWSNTELRGLFAVLGMLGETMTAAAIVEALLAVGPEFVADKLLSRRSVLSEV